MDKIPSSYFYIDQDISKSYTLPTQVYTDERINDFLKKNLFLNSWQWVGGNEIWNGSYNLFPFMFLQGYISEPLLMSKSENGVVCMSNVCTHRAKILVEVPTNKKLFSCAYHGRCFDLNGKMRSMPEFDLAQNFPSQDDHLPHYFLSNFFGFYFVSLKTNIDFDQVIQPIKDHLHHFPYEQLVYKENLSNDYEVNAHWLAYCDNFLEGFHIPYVHPALSSAIEYENYTLRCYDHCNVQVAFAKEGQPFIDLQPSDTDYGKKVYAYYWFIYPNIMLNFYHWGISVNIVEPKGIGKTKIKFRTYIREDIQENVFENTALHLTELEDEAIVESVQQGLQSIAYKRGRFSPTREQGVHAFHRYIYETCLKKFS